MDTVREGFTRRGCSQTKPREKFIEKTSFQQNPDTSLYGFISAIFGFALDVEISPRCYVASRSSAAQVLFPARPLWLGFARATPPSLLPCPIWNWATVVFVPRLWGSTVYKRLFPLSHCTGLSLQHKHSTWFYNWGERGWAPRLTGTGLGKGKWENLNRFFYISESHKETLILISEVCTKFHLYLFICLSKKKYTE